MKTDEVRLEFLPVAGVSGHPLNRDFPREGEVWESFLASVKEHGVLQPLVVRLMPDGGGWQALAGHRRLAAAGMAGLKKVPCVIRDCDERGAVEFLLLENLQRADLDPIEEGRLVSAMLEAGASVEDVATRISRSVEWVTARQGVLDLGDEVRAALRVRRGECGHLSMGAAAALLMVPAEERARAEQLVLHPDWQDEPLGARDAEATVRKLVLEPLRRRLAWEQGGAALKKAWAGKLAKALPKETAKELAVMLGRWDEVQGGWDKLALEEIFTEEVTAAGKGRTWAELATRHGLAVRILPGGEGGVAVVDSRLLRQAEEARAEMGLETWLRTGKAAKPKDKAVARAEAALSGDGELDYSEEEPPEPVATPGAAEGTKITQTMEHAGMIDLGTVKRVAMWAVATDSDPQQAPEWVPMWAKEMAMEGDWEFIDRVCNWVMGLRVGR
jgi:ParB/RepB/Spo0J family partition protein